MLRFDGAHDADLIEEGEFVRLVVGVDCILFGEGLHCEMALVGEALDLVDCGEPALS